MATHYLACDLGAESGRVMLATLDNWKITLALHWNLDALFAELRTGI